MSKKNRVKREQTSEALKAQKEHFLKMGFDDERATDLARSRLRWLKRTGRADRT